MEEMVIACVPGNTSKKRTFQRQSNQCEHTGIEGAKTCDLLRVGIGVVGCSKCG